MTEVIYDSEDWTGRRVVSFHISDLPVIALEKRAAKLRREAKARREMIKAERNLLERLPS